MKLANQTMNVNMSIRTMYDHIDLVNITLSELYGAFKPSATPNFDQMQTMEFNEDCLVQELNEFFTTLKKADCLKKYNLKFTIIEAKQATKNK
jgi:hypothetical protein